MSVGGVRGVLVASPDVAMYRLKLLGSTRTVLVTVEQALRAKRKQLDGVNVTLRDRGTGIIRSLDPKSEILPQFSSNAISDMCAIEWTDPNKCPPYEVSFAEVLEHAVDPFLGVALQNTYDSNQVYTLRLSKAVILQGVLYYEAKFDDGDVDLLSKEEVLQMMNPSIVVPIEEVTAPPLLASQPPRPFHIVSESGQNAPGACLSSAAIVPFQTVPTEVTTKSGSNTISTIRAPYQRVPSAPSTQSDKRLALANGWSSVMVDLRQAIANHHRLHIDGTHVTCYGDVNSVIFCLPTSTCTGFFGKMKTDTPLTLGPIAMYAKHRHLSYAEYLRLCRADKVDIMSIADINALHPFLNGRNDPPPGYTANRLDMAFNFPPGNALPATSSLPESPVTAATSSFAESPVTAATSSLAESPVPTKDVSVRMTVAVPVTPTKEERNGSPCTSDDEPLIAQKQRRRSKYKRKMSSGSSRNVADMAIKHDNNQALDIPPSANPELKRTKATTANTVTSSPTSSPTSFGTERVVTVTVHSVGLRMSLKELPGNRYPIVGSFKRGPRDEVGEVELAKTVHVGAELTHVGATHVARMTVGAVVDLIKIIKRPTTFTFRNPGHAPPPS
ncbi:hypothetical protein DYB32_008358 [Aphanomyces invadans]|uniref:Uncharacterized protein n=1 Tax=Aphanomyces invadans TaxID=157072 RepID=A0A418ALG7_9STRA|nr:hypothetical protein DYB32_008358 [Aphanomyces invadans]